MLADRPVTTMLPVLEMERARGVLGSEKAAGFKDTEGNSLCIHEDLP